MRNFIIQKNPMKSEKAFNNCEHLLNIKVTITSNKMIKLLKVCTSTIFLLVLIANVIDAAVPQKREIITYETNSLENEEPLSLFISSIGLKEEGRWKCQKCRTLKNNWLLSLIFACS